ncbi:Mss4-like protein [Biscogniauxia mediterranea]|nr:Mss4-like protein [Biscogniauxia mediterranea]
MPTGSCLCGNIRISYEGQPSLRALCYCTDCRKVSGSMYSTNLIVADSDFRVTAGTPKRFAKVADSGNEITSFFCPDCGTTLWREAVPFPGSKIVKAGTLDDADAIAKEVPAVELWACRRPAWVPGLSGTTQLQEQT